MSDFKLWLIKQWLRIKLFWFNEVIPKWRKWLIITVIFLGLCAGIIISIRIKNINYGYYYKDWNNEVGIAAQCWEKNGQLICDRVYGGTISVQSFWK